MTKNKENDKQKVKKLIKLLLIITAALLLISGVLFIISLLLKGGKIDYTEKQDGVFYFSADYEEAPLSDLVYANKNRDIMFTDHIGNGEVLTKDNLGENGAKQLMYSYFTALMEGDAEAHSALLSQNYKKNFVVQEKFTPQKVYDINVKFLMSDSYDGAYVDRYQVSYKIYENDGTYRADVGSNVAKIMVFDVVKENGNMYIASIVPMNVK